MTTVSVVIPVYNHEKYIRDAVTSVLHQDHDEVEIICIDDGSRDGSVGELLSIAAGAKRVVRVVPQGNAGAHAALNHGAKLAQGDLLMFLNSDDMHSPSRARVFARTWERLGRPDHFWGFSGVDFVDESGARTDPRQLGVAHLADYTDFIMRGCWATQLLPWHNVALTSGNVVITPALFRAVGGFEPFRMVHDWALVLRCLATMEPVVIQELLYTYRIHGTNTFRSIEVEEGWRESAIVRDNFTRMYFDKVVASSVLDSGSPALSYLRMAYDLAGPRTY